MRGLPDAAVVRNDAPSGADSPSTVSARTPTMRPNDANGLQSRSSDAADAPTAGSGFDARRRLAGDYDHVHFQRARMAQGFSDGSRGDD
ncbi:hypothetical protein AFNJKBDN_CDS0040 [Halorubrum virus V_ICIS4]|nr:hypothetical protein AFNJKBDN_CDS0040 [Halorubrum virus V_ICIS4]